MTQLSPHFSLEEATVSQEAARHSIDNMNPSDDVVAAAKVTAAKLEMVRTILNRPVHINSWVRCLALNRVLGSKDSSAHIRGEAVDFICPEFGTPTEICVELLKSKELLRWDQLILEHTWVHIAWNSVPTTPNRGEVLSLLLSGGYACGLTDASGISITQPDHQFV